jgi:hypothetical protein
MMEHALWRSSSPNQSSHGSEPASATVYTITGARGPMEAGCSVLISSDPLTRDTSTWFEIPEYRAIVTSPLCASARIGTFEHPNVPGQTGRSKSAKFRLGIHAGYAGPGEGPGQALLGLDGHGIAFDDGGAVGEGEITSGLQQPRGDSGATPFRGDIEADDGPTPGRALARERAHTLEAGKILVPPHAPTHTQPTGISPENASSPLTFPAAMRSWKWRRARRPRIASQLCPPRSTRQYMHQHPPHAPFSPNNSAI